MESGKGNVADKKIEVKSLTISVYKRRWLFVFLLTVLELLNSFEFAGFGQVSDFYHAYFQASYVEIDWLTITPFFGVVFASPILATFCFFEYINLKYLIITSSMCATIACALILLAVAKTHLFICAIVGQVFTGIAAAILVAVPPIFGVVWFPTEELGLSMSLIMFGIPAGSILGYLLPTNVLKSPPKKFAEIKGNWTIENSDTMRTMYFTFLMASAFILLLFVLTLPKKPANYPSLAQAKKEENSKLNTVKRRTFRMLIAEARSLFSLTFFLMSISMGVIFHVNSVELILMSEIVNFVGVNSDSSLPTKIVTGYVMSLMAFGGLVGSPVSGLFVDKFQKPHFQAIIASAVACVASCGLILGYVYRNFVVIGVSNALYGFFIRMSIVPLYKLIIEHTYPIDEIFVSLNVVGLQALIGGVAAETGRLIYSRTSGLGVLIFQTLMLLAATIITCFAKPTLHRQRANEDDKVMDPDSAY